MAAASGLAHHERPQQHCESKRNGVVGHIYNLSGMESHLNTFESVHHVSGQVVRSRAFELPQTIGICIERFCRLYLSKSYVLVLRELSQTIEICIERFQHFDVHSGLEEPKHFSVCFLKVLDWMPRFASSCHPQVYKSSSAGRREPAHQRLSAGRPSARQISSDFDRRRADS